MLVKAFCITCCPLVMCLVVLDFAARTSHAQEPESRRYALLVGVRNYDENQLRSLPYPENDVVELGEVLKESGFRRVVLLTQTEGAKTQRFLPLAKNVRTSLAGLLEDRTKDDLVLVAFAGHGVQFKGEPENYFCPMDAVLTDRSSLVALSEVYQLLEQSKAGTKLLIVDACRNDPLAGNARDVGDVRLESLSRPQRVAPPGGIASLFSCSEGQRAFESDKLKHGVFFHHVIQGLKGEAKLKRRDEVTWDSLVAHVKAEVPDTVKDLFGDQYRQIPENKGELRGGATLVSLAKPNVPTPPPSVTPSTPTTLGQKEITSKSTGMKLTLIPAGTFLMGSSAADIQPAVKADPNFKEEYVKGEQPQHSVRISKPFYMGVYEVTQGEYETVMGTNPSRFSKTGAGKDAVNGMDTSRFPVETVSWFDAIEFCNKLSVKDGLTAYYNLTNVTRENGSITSATVTEVSRAASAPGLLGYRLPTEAEWEYACRANSKSLWHTGNTLASLNEAGWWGAYSTPAGNSDKRTNRVGQKTKNEFGLYDMHGNVYEWCFDVYDESTYGQRTGITNDPVSSSGSEYRVLRGGSWGFNARVTRAANRGGGAPDYRDCDCGFRVVR